MAKALRPLFVTVTWGAGGSTAARSLELAELCQRQLGLTTCLHLTCTNMSKAIIDETLDEAKAIGICNILALRGDPPREEYHAHNLDGSIDSNKDFVWAVDLVKYIRIKYGDFFCIGVAAYPDGHADESHPISQSIEFDLPFLIEKVQAGADFIMTQLFYDEAAFLHLEKTLRQHESGFFSDIPIIPGLMPIQSYQILRRTAKLSHASLPTGLMERLDKVKGDDEAVKEIGVEALTSMIKTIRNVEALVPRGFHFYTLNLEKAVGWILEKANLIPKGAVHDDIDTKSQPSQIRKQGTDGIANNHDLETAASSHSRHSSIAPSQAHLSTFQDNRGSATQAQDLAVTHGLTPAGREATWDDYPNGRFGDARSPAFNSPLSYSPYAFSVPPHEARKLWGQPSTSATVTGLFARHVQGHEPSQLPWSESSTLSAETRLISKKLLSLINDRAWWTIASQPAVDGLPSSDSVHGWGPPGGFVFQKPFLEFFIPSRDWHEHLRPRLLQAKSASEISWYAENGHYDFESSESSESVHAVTWGSFVGKEIVTATMVEQVNFRQWAEEAFFRWEQWSCVVLQKESRNFLQRQREDLWLVNVIGHGYRSGEGNRLWEILTGP